MMGELKPIDVDRPSHVREFAQTREMMGLLHGNEPLKGRRTLSGSATEEIKIGGLAVRFLLEGRLSGGGIAMFEFDVAAQAKLPMAHSHDGYEETIYGLEGVLTFTVDGKRIDIGPGDVLCIPRGAVHRFDNFGSDCAKMLAILTPGILGPDFFREIAFLIERTSGPPDFSEFATIMRRHGLTPAP